MFPIGDENEQGHGIAFVTLAMVATNILVFLFQASLPSDASLQSFVTAWGVVPREYATGQDLPPVIGVPYWSTLVTSMFLHGGWGHLGGNMLFLWVFGDNVENAFGSLKYLVFYLLCGVAAAGAQILTDVNSLVPMIGASGAVAGVMGAYLVMFPGATVRTLVFIVFFVTVVQLPAIILIGLWFLLQVFQGLASVGMEAGTAFWAHVGGLIVGAALAFLFRRRDYRVATPTVYRGY